MKGQKKYNSPVAMRTALEERLNCASRANNQDILRLRRKVAFDRVLARIFTSRESSRMVLKGGYALELRLHSARTTKDIDISIDASKEAIAHNQQSLLKILQQASAIDLGDFFEYAVGESILDPIHLRDAIKKTFLRRKTHQIPAALENPPESWRERYKKLATECSTSGDINSAIDRIREFYKTVIAPK
jgi:hypothetical protein